MAIPTPYAGSYYPLYNSGTNQFIPPDTQMPFDKVSALFFAFAHAYPVSFDYNGNPVQSALSLEAGQPPEAFRISETMLAARSVNPGILFYFPRMGQKRLDIHQRGLRGLCKRHKSSVQFCTERGAVLTGVQS